MRSEYLGWGPLSPDRTKLAAWREQERELVVWDVDNGVEIASVQAMILSTELGPITWSPSSQALVYVLVASYCPLSGKSYIVHLGLPELKQTLLLESEKPTFGRVTWDVPDELKLFDENGKQWSYSFATYQLKPMP